MEAAENEHTDTALTANQPTPSTTQWWDVGRSADRPDWMGRCLTAIAMGCLLLVACIWSRGGSTSTAATAPPQSSIAALPNSQFPNSQSATPLTGELTLPAGLQHLVTRPIEEIRVGQRVLGRNPLREEVEAFEPDPATWAKVSLHLEKESGQSVWVELLRPLAWIEAAGARPGQSFRLELYEFGAVGEARVLAVGRCPEIEPGTGTVVTGTFRYQADENSHVVNLRLEGETEPTGVTDNHPYWSVDRSTFVPVGERVNTEFGTRRIASITPREYTDFLHNFETTEHVYRVAALGVSVHNSQVGCVRAKRQTRRDDVLSGKSRCVRAGRLDTPYGTVPYGAAANYFSTPFAVNLDVPSPLPASGVKT